MSQTKLGFDPLSSPESNATGYTEPHRVDNQRRWNRRIGDHAGLTNFGVNITRLITGGQLSTRHWLFAGFAAGSGNVTNNNFYQTAA